MKKNKTNIISSKEIIEEIKSLRWCTMGDTYIEPDALKINRLEEQNEKLKEEIRVLNNYIEEYNKLFKHMKRTNEIYADIFWNIKG